MKNTGCKLTYEEVDRDMWTVLKKKTTGMAKRKIESLERGQGIKAYYTLAKWFHAATGMSIQETRTRLMRPVQAKKESDIMGK